MAGTEGVVWTGEAANDRKRKMTMEESAEKRRFKRVSLSLPVSGKYRRKPFRGTHFQGETQDVSYYGLCIRVANSNGYRIGQGVKLRTRLYKGDFSIKVQGVVCWINERSDDDRPILIGVSLTRIRRFGLWCERIEQKLMYAS